MNILTRLVDQAIEEGIIIECTYDDVLSKAKKNYEEGFEITQYLFYYQNEWHEDSTFVHKDNIVMIDCFEGIPLQGYNQYEEEDDSYLAEKHAMFLDVPKI